MYGGGQDFTSSIASSSAALSRVDFEGKGFWVVLFNFAAVGGGGRRRKVDRDWAVGGSGELIWR